MAKNLHSIHANDMLLSLAVKLPNNLMLDAEDVEGIFTFNLLLRLNDKQLEDLKKQANLQKDENVFLYFYIRHEGSHEASVEFNDFESFDFKQIRKIIFNGNTAPLLSYSDLAPVHYVSVTLVVA